MGAQWKARHKEVAANARGKIFGKLAKEIMVAAKGGADIAKPQPIPDTVVMLADLLPRTLSFEGAKRLLCTFFDQLRRTSGTQIRTLIATVTACIATLRLPFRPNRIEPRAKKRRPKNLPLLTVPRQVARDLIYAQRELNRVP